MEQIRIPQFEQLLPANTVEVGLAVPEHDKPAVGAGFRELGETVREQDGKRPWAKLGRGVILR